MQWGVGGGLVIGGQNHDWDGGICVYRPNWGGAKVRIFNTPSAHFPPIGQVSTSWKYKDHYNLSGPRVIRHTKGVYQ